MREVTRDRRAPAWPFCVSGRHRRGAPAGATVAPDTPDGAQFDISVAAYRLAAGAIVAGYVAVWLASLPNVYGWLHDDLLFYAIGVETVHDWETPFLLSFNINHLFPYVTTHLPLLSGLSVPSYPLPNLGEETGRFRLVILWMVVLHTVLLATWAWFATRLTGSRLVATLSLLLFATSPSLTLWTPQLDSRFAGLPLVLLGIWLLLDTHRLGALGRRSVYARSFLAGSLFGAAQSIQYNTPLYLIAPVLAVFAALRLARGWRTADCWLGLAALGLGCAWLHGLAEVLSYAVVGLPPDKGPTMTLLHLRSAHRSHWPLATNLVIWGELLLNQLGLPLLVAAAVGWVGHLRAAGRAGPAGRADRLTIGLAIPLGLLYLGLSTSSPGLRQTAVLQPFIFFFAATGMVMLAERARGRPPVRVALMAGLFLATAATPATHAWTVLQAHQGLGRALAWTHANKGERHLEWLPIDRHYERADLARTDDLDRLPPDTLLLSYHPGQFFGRLPTLEAHVVGLEPLAGWPVLESTDAMWAEAKGGGGADVRAERFLSEAWVLEARQLTVGLGGAPLPVADVRADSSGSPLGAAAKVMDRDRSTDGVTTWVSAASPMPHAVELHFANPEVVDEARVVIPPRLSQVTSAWRIAGLDVQALEQDGQFRTVWSGAEGIERRVVIQARWSPVRTTGLRFVIHRQGLPWADTDQAGIEEIVLPGRQLVAAEGRPPAASPEGWGLSPEALLPPGATLAAIPTTVPAEPGRGITTIVWDTLDASPGQVWLSQDGGPERLVAEAPRGRVGAPWIAAGSSFTFRLYRGTERATMLGEVTVRGGPPR